MNQKDVIIACDFSSAEETLAFLDRFGGRKPYVKIGMELYYAAGPDMVRRILERGHRVFLDLKLHDIPNTVQKAMKNLARLGVDMTNLHAAGGKKMMQAAVEGLAEGAAEAGRERPLLIAVTQLTSTSAEMLKDELLIGTLMEETVAHYASNAAQSGLDGVVCSPHEAAAVKRANGQDFLTVTPGHPLRRRLSRRSDADYDSREGARHRHRLYRGRPRRYRSRRPRRAPICAAWRHLPAA